MPYVDTSRPPPPMNSLPPQGMSYPTQIPTFGTGQYLGGGPVNSYIPIQNPPMQGSSVQYGFVLNLFAKLFTSGDHLFRSTLLDH